MSKGLGCFCEPKEKSKDNWRVVHYKCNYSAFSGYKKTPSDYSALRCTKCGARWRTNAAYVSSIKFDMNE